MMLHSSFNSLFSLPIFSLHRNYLYSMNGALVLSCFVPFVAVLLYSGIDSLWLILCKLFIWHWVFKSTEEELEHSRHLLPRPCATLLYLTFVWAQIHTGKAMMYTEARGVMSTDLLSAVFDCRTFEAGIFRSKQKNKKQTNETAWKVKSTTLILTNCYSLYAASIKWNWAVGRNLFEQQLWLSDYEYYYYLL